MARELMIVGCPSCKQNAPMRHLHSEVHGLSGTHLDGSERFECCSCGYTLTRDEAESRSLVFTLDVEKRHCG